MDVDAVALSIFFGRDAEPEIPKNYQQVHRKAHRYDMPVLAEMIPAADKMYDIDHRPCFPLRYGDGCNIIKTNYAGS